MLAGVQITRHTIALVTGSTRGIGAQVARLLAERGATVIGHGRTGGPSARNIAADLSVPGQGGELYRSAVGRHGRIDLLVHCAGIGHYGPLADTAPERTAELLAVNLHSVLDLTQAAVTDMTERGRGHLVFVSSIAGLLGVANEAVYSATKAGVVGLSEALRQELAGTGVGVSLVCPGAVRTDFFQGRGAPYDRRFPRPLSAGAVARSIVSAIEHDRARVVRPRWLAIAPAVQAVTPGGYTRLARRFG